MRYPTSCCNKVLRYIARAFFAKHNILATRMGSVKPSPLLTDPTAQDWIYFRDRFDDFLTFSELTAASEERKKALLLMTIGREGSDLLDGLPDPKVTYTECISRLNEYFGEKSSILLRRKVFFSSRQEVKETANAFACRLRRLASECAFGANRETLLRDIFVIGILNDRLGEKLLAEDENTLTFDLAIKKAEAFERARQERASSRPAVALLKQSTRRSPFPPRAADQPRPPSTSPNFVPSHREGKPSRVCYRCGSSTHLANAKNCPARNSTCKSCSKQGHWKKMCKSSSSKVRHVAEASSSSCTKASDSSGEDPLNIFAAAASSLETQKEVAINDY